MTTAKEPRGVGRQRTTVSRAEMAAILADYDPLRAAGLGGVPKDWPLCECGGEKCPDRGLAE
ncbi:hypothetical protein ABH930_004374 [Kitasatospora sp. GAS204A]|uniref:hypothetical protein n=1 Tax=unclassified Kitasatospora TaxID=2633591 RepID=UPI0024734D16|nr:hypothetical protein [Kitasatospora sp. GAS204B]MDH6119616.1 hypothetical protein [Kitasatospora sp. GAS204B]